MKSQRVRKHSSRVIRFVLLVALATLPFHQPLDQEDLALCAGLIAFGIFWRAWASGHLDKGSRVCETGPFALCRHPLYLGTLILMAGYLKLWLPWGVSVGVLIVLGALDLWRAAMEEERLLERFSEAYSLYRRRVPSLLFGPVGLYRAVRDRTLWKGFEPGRIWKNGDLYRTVCAFVGLVVVLVYWEYLKTFPISARSFFNDVFTVTVLVSGGLMVGYLLGRALPNGLRDLLTFHISWRAARDLGREYWEDRRSESHDPLADRVG